MIRKKKSANGFYARFLTWALAVSSDPQDMVFCLKSWLDIGEQWLNDTCVYVASLRVAEETRKFVWRQSTQINVVDSICIQMADVTRRKRNLDTMSHTFSKIQTNRIVYCPALRIIFVFMLKLQAPAVAAPSVLSSLPHPIRYHDQRVCISGVYG